MNPLLLIMEFDVEQVSVVDLILVVNDIFVEMERGIWNLGCHS